MSTKDNRISLEGKGRYPFTTPEGYFDDLTARIMKQIPEDTATEDSKVIAISKTPPRRTDWWKNISTVAASLILIAMVAARLLSAPSETLQQAKQSESKDVSTDDYNEDLINYAMTDNIDVYCYLAGEGSE